MSAFSSPPQVYGLQKVNGLTMAWAGGAARWASGTRQTARPGWKKMAMTEKVDRMRTGFASCARWADPANNSSTNPSRSALVREPEGGSSRHALPETEPSSAWCCPVGPGSYSFGPTPPCGLEDHGPSAAKKRCEQGEKHRATVTRSEYRAQRSRSPADGFTGISFAAVQTMQWPGLTHTPVGSQWGLSQQLVGDGPAQDER